MNVYEARQKAKQDRADCVTAAAEVVGLVNSHLQAVIYCDAVYEDVPMITPPNHLSNVQMVEGGAYVTTTIWIPR